MKITEVSQPPNPYPHLWERSHDWRGWTCINCGEHISDVVIRESYGWLINQSECQEMIDEQHRRDAAEAMIRSPI